MKIKQQENVMDNTRWMYDTFPEYCISEVTGKYIIYGIKVLRVKSAVSEVVSVRHFISEDYNEIRKMVKLFNDEQLDPVHLSDVLHDLQIDRTAL